jgi:glycosyltransferase involved in cell wall biosynthesis
MTMEACDAFVGSTAALCEHATAVTGLRAERLPNGVGLGIGRVSDDALRRPRRPGPLRVGYFSGTNTHDRDWRFVEGAVAEVLERHPAVELWLVGYVPPTPTLERFGDRIVRRPLLAWEQLPALLRDLAVNLAPLAPDSRFNDAKSAIKWLEAALVATPTIASPTEPFREAIAHARTGWLAAEPDAWVDGLDRLLSDADLRLALGRRARRDALLRFSPHAQGRTYLRILETAPLRHGTSPAPAWPEDVLDEPPMPPPSRPVRRDPMRVVGAAVRRLRVSASRRLHS